MPSHEIKMVLPASEVINKDVTIRVKSGESALGRLEISKGSIDWWPSNNSSNFYRMTWERFATLMAEEGKAVKKN